MSGAVRSRPSGSAHSRREARLAGEVGSIRRFLDDPANELLTWPGTAFVKVYEF